MILDQLCRDTGYHRKHAIRLMNRLPTAPDRRGRKPVYGDGARYHLRKLWLAMDQMSARPMKRMLPAWVRRYRAPGYGPHVEREILAMSHATIERVLRPFRAQAQRSLNSGTRRAKLKCRIPIKPLDKKIDVPGYVEADTVAHCGESMSGEFIWSLTGVDRLSGWTEVRAVWHKLSPNVVTALEDIEKHAPFVIKGLSTDNGGEFINRELIRHLGFDPRRGGEIFMTRSRPYKKNDQCYVEQKNYTHVRKLLGYDRLDNPAILPILNDLYRNEWSDMQNYFVPQMKTIEKLRVGGKIRRKFSDPMTPHERLMQSAQIPEEKKRWMQEKFERLDPFELRAGIDRKLAKIFRLQDEFDKKRNPRASLLPDSLPPGSIIQ
jgi:hypothetical protein